MNKDFKVEHGTTINMLQCKQESIGKVMGALTGFLIAKNKNYGNSALEPLKVFSKVEPTNGICVRMDDKLSRIVNSSELRKNDIVDLTGYLVLLCTQKGWDDFKELID